MNNTCPNCGAKDRGYSIASWTCGSRKDFQTGKFIKSKECASAKRAARIAELERQLEEYTESLANVRPSAEADSEEVARLMVENRKLERQLAEAKADNENLNRMLRGTGYGQGAIDAYVAQCEELERVTADRDDWRQKHDDCWEEVFKLRVERDEAIAHTMKTVDDDLKLRAELDDLKADAARYRQALRRVLVSHSLMDAKMIVRPLIEEHADAIDAAMQSDTEDK